MISINNNLMASNVANTLTSHYGRLSTSVERLSSGLRINRAADDAAGLAIREMMRADIAALNQGVRNANDAISMIQTFDGALGVIDEKLIRMKELAEQAATGTYTSDQRLMIDSEFQAMGSEIDRIANATDFNGVKLLCTKMMTWYEDVTKFRITDPGSIANLNISGGQTGTPVLRGVNANNYVNEANPQKTISVSLTATTRDVTTSGTLAPRPQDPGNPNRTSYDLLPANPNDPSPPYRVSYVDTLGNVKPIIEFGATGWSVKDPGNKITYQPPSYIPGYNAQWTSNGYDMNNSPPSQESSISFSMENNAGLVDLTNIDPSIVDMKFDTASNSWSITRKITEITNATADYTASYDEANQTVTVRLANGGTVSMKLDNPLAAGDTISFDINFEGEVNTEPEERHGVDPNQKVKIHFGPGNDSAEDYYYIKYANCTREGLGIDDVRVDTQEKAQDALVQLNDAIVAKDKVRADYGAMQNRLENTMTNLQTQSENLQAAESRISDADIAREMTTFVRNQVLTNSAVAMLAQANSVPQMVMRLVGA